jgi:hypothetical protein
MYAGKARSLARGDLKDRLFPFANIRLDWEAWLLANAPAYLTFFARESV